MEISGVSGNGLPPAARPPAGARGDGQRLPTAQPPSASPAGGSQPATAPARTLQDTYVQIHVDPKTDAVSVTVRDADNDEVVAELPVGSAGAAAKAQGYSPGLLVEGSA
ncbi:MAG: hypothetical protein ACYDAG_11620 [Chloroflexota bacterium]